jgi:hypothetical protein
MANRMVVLASAALVAIFLTMPELGEGATHRAKPRASVCLISLAAVRSPLRFSEFPAIVPPTGGGRC